MHTVTLTAADHEAFGFYCRKFGMECVLTLADLQRIQDELAGKGNCLNAAYGANCDVLAGVSVKRALAVNINRNKETN